MRDSVERMAWAVRAGGALGKESRIVLTSRLECATGFQNGAATKLRVLASAGQRPCRSQESALRDSRATKMELSH